VQRTCDDGTSKAIATVQADTVATRRPVDFDLASVWREGIGWVLGGDTALDSEATGRDAVLS
jgi:hypothetical protein